MQLFINFFIFFMSNFFRLFLSQGLPVTKRCKKVKKLNITSIFLTTIHGRCWRKWFLTTLLTAEDLQLQVSNIVNQQKINYSLYSFTEDLYFLGDEVTELTANNYFKISIPPMFPTKTVPMSCTCYCWAGQKIDTTYCGRSLFLF